MKVNVFVISRRGILDTPIVVLNDETASAVFEGIVEKELKDDISEIKFLDEGCIEKVNSLLRYSGTEISWFCDIEVNKYKNGN